MRAALHIVLVLLAVPVTIGLSEFTFIELMKNLPLDVTGAPILRASMWAHFAITGIMTFAVSKLLAHHLPWLPVVYFGGVLGLYIFFMLSTGNPTLFTLQYMLPVVGGFAIWGWLFRKRIWSQSSGS